MLGEWWRLTKAVTATVKHGGRCEDCVASVHVQYFSFKELITIIIAVIPTTKQIAASSR